MDIACGLIQTLGADSSYEQIRKVAAKTNSKALNQAAEKSFSETDCYPREYCAVRNYMWELRPNGMSAQVVQEKDMLYYGSFNLSFILEKADYRDK